MTKEEVIAAMLKFAAMLDRVPSRDELMRLGGVKRLDIRRHFGTLERLRRECKLERAPRQKRLDMERLFHDWGRVAREVKRLPTMQDYERLGEYSIRPYVERFGRWMNVPAGMKRYAEEHGFGEDWLDVLVQIKHKSEGRLAGPMTFAGQYARTVPGHGTYGVPILCGALVFAPTTENGVLFLFGAIADKLGFLVLRVQSEFPDIEALRMVGKDKLQRVRIEVEQESKNFLKHGHDPNGCDLIVCWEDNWPEAPVEVVELSKAIGSQRSAISQNKPKTLPRMNTDERG
ncbi:MAG TPA: hypothetical protein VKH81_25560 [Candidatus Angelobacter sp.]|nr:hypothetical protein [Candidatus Angelobacter sp.]